MPLPQMHKVESSYLHAVGHSGDALYAQFKDDPTRTWRYVGVPQGHCDAIRNADSPGGYFHKAVRAARYPGVEVTDG